MIFNKLFLNGAYLIDLEKIEDERGFFARVFCFKEFQKHALKNNLIQCSISYNRKTGTLRGLHYQLAPHAEAKIVRCSRGAIYDVIVDLRADSKTYLHWIGVELKEENHSLLYVPEGFAHGYQTLTQDAEVFYQTSTNYSPEDERGLRWDDPLLQINWPLTVNVISQKDQNYPNYEIR